MDSFAVSKQIERILHSKTFATKGQLRKLLGILSRHMDSQSDLDPDLVIKELWPEEIRTKRSADVATEMNRLRRALKDYYEDEGESDPITIVLPNRAVATNGTHERPWIIARSRLDSEDAAEETGAAVKSRRGLKKIILITVLASLCIGVAAYVSMRVLAMPDQPRMGRLDGSALVIMDSDGKELWKKIFPDGFGVDWYRALGKPVPILFEDLEGNGHTNVLFVYTPAGQLAHSSTLICYSDRGKEKWRWNPGRALPEMQGSPPTFTTSDVRVLKPTEKKPARIVVSSEYNPWWPDQIALLDSNGKLISEYWHSGTLFDMVLADLDGDGKEEIIATGVANGYDHQATLVVLDPDRVSGASTEVRPEFQIHGMGVAQERLRLLFPRSDLNRALFQYNAATNPAFENGVLRLAVLECITPYPGGCRIYYEFDKNFNLISAYAGSDDFRSAHNRFYQTGKNAHTLSAKEAVEFQKVRCLVGCKSEFVLIGKMIP